MIGLYLNFIDKTKSKIRRKRRKCTSTVNKLENKRFKNKCNLVSQSIYNWTWILFYSFFLASTKIYSIQCRLSKCNLYEKGGVIDLGIDLTLCTRNAHTLYTCRIWTVSFLQHEQQWIDVYDRRCSFYI